MSPPTTILSSLFTIHCVKVSFTLTVHKDSPCSVKCVAMQRHHFLLSSLQGIALPVIPSVGEESLQSSANVSPSILHLAEHNISYANAKVLTLCGRFLFIIHYSLRATRACHSERRRGIFTMRNLVSPPQFKIQHSSFKIILIAKHCFATTIPHFSFF